MPFPADSPLAAVYPEGYGAIDGCDVDVCLLNSIYTEVELKSPEMYPNAVAEGSEPGIEGMRDAAEGITGLEIQYYVLIDMQGFEQLINALGGVDINVETRIPIGGDEDNNDVDGWIEPGQQHLNGYHALWYGRARYGVAGGDYERMARQRVLQEAILTQFTPTNVLGKFQEVATAGADTVKTDVPQSMLGYFANLAMKTKELPMTHVELVPDNGVDPDGSRLGVHPRRSSTRRCAAHRGAGRGRRGVSADRLDGAGRRRSRRQRSACSCQTRSAESRQLNARARSAAGHRHALGEFAAARPRS